MDPRAATCRSKGAVGRNPLVYRVFQENYSKKDAKGLNILDFGAGKDAVHTRKLRDAGYTVQAYDLPENMGLTQQDSRGLIWEENANTMYWDVVLVSNVLNVQGNRTQTNNLFKTLRDMVPQGGQIIMNYPMTPRKAGLSIASIMKMFKKHFVHKQGVVLVEQAAGNHSAPCWIISV